MRISSLFVPVLGASLLFFSTGCKDSDRDGVRDGKDCSDNDAERYPGNEEICDGIDNDCDFLVDEGVSVTLHWDRDGDGFGDPDKARRVCRRDCSESNNVDCVELPEDGVENGDDCNDTDPASNPKAAEICDEQDNNCDGQVDEDVGDTFYEDRDGDGHGVRGGKTAKGCAAPDGFAADTDDCDDREPLAWSGAEEVCDKIDNDCDGTVDNGVPDILLYADTDGDGWGDPNNRVPACGPERGVVDNDYDCDDTKANIGPHASEVSGNSRDEDCDGYLDEYAVPTDYPTIEDALAAAPDGSVIQIEDALYVGIVDLTGRDITLAGKGCGRTVLYGDANGPVLKMDGGRVENISVQGGVATHGGGLRVVGGEVTAQGACFETNYSTWAGGGVAVLDGKLNLLDSSVSRNSSDWLGGGMYVAVNAEVVARRSVFAENSADCNGCDGGALQITGGKVDVASSMFLRNYAGDDGGAVDVDYATSSLLNEEEVDLGGPPTAGDRPGFELRPTGLFIATNVTFDGNEAGDDVEFGESIYVRLSDAVLNNVVFTNHPQEQAIVRDFSGSAGTVTVGYVGSANNAGPEQYDSWFFDAVRGDPRYVRHQAGAIEDLDLRLMPGSPFIDAGDPAILDPDSSRSDLGAFGGPDAPADFNWGYAIDGDNDGMMDGWEAHHGLAWWADDSAADPDGDGLDNGGEHAVLSDPHLVDTDGDGISDAAETTTDPTIPWDQAPVPDGGPDIWGAVGHSITLGGTSVDPDNDTLTYQWSFAGLPAGSNLTDVDAPTMALTSFTPDAIGRYDLEVAVDDGDTVRIDTVAVEVVDGYVVPDDMATIAAAIAASSSGEAVLLQPGTYTEVIEPNGMDLAFVGLGEDRDAVILDGQGLTTPLNMDQDEDVVLANLTVRNGQGVNGGCIFVIDEELASGGSTDNDDPILTLHNVVLHDCVASEYGGALHLESGELFASEVVVRDSSAVRGGGFFLYNTNGTVNRAAFSNNVGEERGGGFYGYGSRDWFIYNSVFSGNASMRGAAIFQNQSSSVMTIENSVFLENVDNDTEDPLSGVWHIRYGTGVSFNNVFAHNHTDEVFGGQWGEYFPYNNLLFDNDGQNFYTPAAGDPDQDIGNRAGTLYTDPQWVLFVNDGDPTNDLLVPRLGSPMVDAGFYEIKDRNGSVSDIGISGGQNATGDLAAWLHDRDGDGMADAWEDQFGLDADTDDSAADNDTDGLTNLVEYQNGLSPIASDTDSDGISDATELAGGDPLDPSDNRPMADAGPDLEVILGNLVNASGVNSSDPNSHPLSFVWTLTEVPNGSSLTSGDLTGNTSTNVSFNPDMRGRYQLTLVVNDGLADSAPDTITVWVSGDLHVPSVYATVADALAIAIPNDRIVLAAGDFAIEPIDIGMNLRLRGSGTDQTFVSGRNGWPAIWVDDGETLDIADLTFSGSTGEYGGAIYCETPVSLRNAGAMSGLLLTDVVLSDNVAFQGGAAFIDNCTAQFDDVHILDNVSSSSGGALFVDGNDTQFLWTRGTAARNISGGFGGVGYFDGGQQEVRNVVCAYNDALSNGGCLYKRGGGLLNLRHNDFVVNDGGTAMVYYQSHASGTVGIIRHNIFIGSPTRGLYFSGSAIDYTITSSHNGFWDNPSGHGFPVALGMQGDEVFQEPMFVSYDKNDAYTFDFHLLAGSPMIDAGLVGQSDQDGTITDIGAYAGPYAAAGWDAFIVDADADGLPDWWEAANSVTTAGADDDGDGLSNIGEYNAGTDPNSTDTDGDGTPDNVELTNSTDPLVAEGAPTADAGNDQVTPVSTAINVTGTGTDPTNDPLNYTWTLVEVPGRSALTTGDLTNAATATVGLTPDSPGAYVLELVVDDGALYSDADRVVVRAPGDLQVPGDYASLGEAIDALVTTHGIDVAAGTWPVNADLGGKDVTIRGASRDTTMLDGEGDGSVLTASNGEALVLQDLTVTGGQALYGGGINQDTGTLTLTDVAFTDNTALFGGAIYTDTVTIDVDGARFVDNVAGRSGGAFFTEGGTATIDQTVFAQNWATHEYGGAWMSVGSTLTFTNVIFHDNAADWGGGLYLTGGTGFRTNATFNHVTATLNGSLADANTQGGFVRQSYSDGTMINSIVAHNEPGSAVAMTTSTSVGPTWTQTYSLFWDNAFYDWYPTSTMPRDVNNNLLNGNVEDTDARLRGISDDGDWSNEDFTLFASSPGTDGGDPASPADVDTSTADMGAFGGPGGGWTP